MKAKFLAVLVLASVAMAPLHSANAGRLDQAVFLAKVAKAKMVDAGRDLKKRAVCKVFGCFGPIKL
jgi:hypothetical protein